MIFAMGIKEGVYFPSTKYTEFYCLSSHTKYVQVIETERTKLNASFEAEM